MDLRTLKGLLEMPVPSEGAQLQQSVCAANWMRRAIPKFSRRLQILTSLLEEVLTMAGGRTNGMSAKIRLRKKLWTQQQQPSVGAVN